MKRNIIFSGADATGKTTRAEKFEREGYNLSVLTKEINLTQDSIKENIRIALEQGNQSNSTVMDRSIIDLLAYYYINEKSGLFDECNGVGNPYGIRNILEQFIALNKGSTVYHMKASKKVIIERLLLREEMGEQLSKNDLKILNEEGYLEDFIETFNKIIRILERVNKKVGSLIEINNIDTTNLPIPIIKI